MLNTGRIEGECIGSGPLRDEFIAFKTGGAKSVTRKNAGREHPILKDETRFGTDWCIAIAQEIIDAERGLRAGKPGDSEVRRYRREETWQRFENL